LALVSLTKPNDVSCDTQVICNIPLLRLGEKRTIVFVVSLTGIGPIDNKVEVTWGGGGGTPHTWTAHADPFPDLRVSKAHGNLVAGQDADSTITVSNIGSGPTTAPITVVDTLPTGLTYKSSSAGGFTCTPSGGTVTCTRTDPLAPQTSTSFT